MRQRIRRRDLTRILGGPLMGATMAAGVASCGTGPTGSQAGVRMRHQVTLQFWSRFTGTGAQTGAIIERLEQQNLPVFMEKFAPIKVERSVTTPYETHIDKLTVAFASGTGPDVYNVGSPGVAQFAGPGFAMQVDTVAAVRKEAEDYLAAPLNVGKYKGKLYGLTYLVSPELIMYHKDVLAQSGVAIDRRSLPKTWDQFRDVAHKVTRWEGPDIARVGFNVPKSGYQLEALFMTLLKQQGKDALTADLTKPQFHGVEGERALQLLVDLLHRDRVDAVERPKIVIPQGLPTMATTHFGSTWTGAGILTQLRQAQIDPAQTVVTDLLPEWTGRPTSGGYLGGTWLLANKATKEKDATMDLFLYLAGAEHTFQIAEQTVTPPARKSGERLPFIQDPVFKPFYEMQSNAWTVPQHQRFELVRQKNQAMLAEALQQKRSVKEAISEMAAYATTELAQG